jgi:hypothetical protein
VRFFFFYPHFLFFTTQFYCKIFMVFFRFKGLPPPPPLQPDLALQAEI